MHPLKDKNSKANDNWGDIDAPELYLSSCAGEFGVYVYGTVTDPNTLKLSVVLIGEVSYSIVEGDCPECNMELGDYIIEEMELDFGSNDAGELDYPGLTCDYDPDAADGSFEMFIPYSLTNLMAEAELADYIADQDCLSCVVDVEFGAAVAKAKGLAPGKGKGRQNNEFSVEVDIDWCDVPD